MLALLFFVVVVAAPALTVDRPDAEKVCKAASLVLKDMRYHGGKYADPGDFSPSQVKERLDHCIKAVRVGTFHGEKVAFATAAIGYRESNFRPEVVGAAGEVGMMQVIPRLHCTKYPDLDDGKGGCINPVRAGVRAFRLLLASELEARPRWIPIYSNGDPCRWDGLRVPTLCRVLRRYNGSQRYATAVAGFVRSVEWAYRRDGHLAKAD